MNKTIQGNANGLVEQAKQTVANVASDAKAGVTSQLEHRIDQAKERIDQAKGVGIEKIETVSEALRGAGEKLEGTGPLPDLAEKAAEGIQNLARYFENKDVGDLFDGVNSFARRQPLMFLGGAVALGVLAGRFLKSSARRNPTEYSYSGGDVGGDPYETLGYEGDYGADGDYLSADDLEDDWDTADPPMAFQSESAGIGVSSATTTASATKSDWSRTTQPQGSSFAGNTEKMPMTQGSGSAGLAGASSTGSSAIGGGINVGEAKKEANEADDFFSSTNKSSR